MKKLAVYGAGGFGRETILLIEQINAVTPRWEIIGFYDDGIEVGTTLGKWKVLGGYRQLNHLNEPLDVAIAIADPSIRRNVWEKITNPAIDYPVIVHPHCLSGDPDNRFGKGCILTAGIILTTGIQLGDFVIINLTSTIGHDVVVGEFTTIMPGCNISGNVRIGESCMIGTGAKLLQNLSVGKQSVVGAGAVVTHDFAENKTIIGIPAHEK